MRENEIDLDTVTIAYLEDGPVDGPLVICLHGFPDSRASFRHLTPALTNAGYRVVVPALRGYGPSSLAHDGVYHTSALAHDVISLHERCGGDERAIVIGHDWGAAATYLAVMAAPERFSRAVTMAVPPLAAMAGAMLRFDQLQRSWYMWLFQLPIAEFAVAANDAAFLDRLWEQWSPGYDGRDDVRLVKAALDSPERIAAAIGYYRAMFSPGAPPAPYEEMFAARRAAHDPLSLSPRRPRRLRRVPRLRRRAPAPPRRVRRPGAGGRGPLHAPRATRRGRAPHSRIRHGLDERWRRPLPSTPPARTPPPWSTSS